MHKNTLQSQLYFTEILEILLLFLHKPVMETPCSAIQRATMLPPRFLQNGRALMSCGNMYLNCPFRCDRHNEMEQLTRLFGITQTS